MDGVLQRQEIALGLRKKGSELGSQMLGLSGPNAMREPNRAGY